MPIIRVLLQSDKQKIDPKAALMDISADVGVEPERLNLFVETFMQDSCFRASGITSPIINISARAHNGREWIQSLMAASTKAVAKQLQVSEDSIMVYVNFIEDGYLLSNGKFI